jgi:hypothetical protein
MTFATKTSRHGERQETQTDTGRENENMEEKGK